MIVYPAIDLRGGQVVNLIQGDFDRETAYGDDPVSHAQYLESQGAEWLHVVDLDGARGTGDHRRVIAGICEAMSIPIQVGGGVRDGSLLDIGVSRLIAGSLLFEDRPACLELLQRFPGQVALGLDHANGQLKISGWHAEAGATLADVMTWPEVELAVAVIVTAISADGMLAGPDVSGTRDLAATSPVPVIASGGVSSTADITAIKSAGAAGVIVGRALYEGRFTLPEALETATDRVE